MSHRRLRRLAFLFNLLTWMCWGLAGVAFVCDFKFAPVSPWFYGATLVLPVVLGLALGNIGSWFSRQRDELEKKWEAQFSSTSFILRTLSDKLTPEFQEVIRCIWSEDLSTVISVETMIQRSACSKLGVLHFQCEFLAMIMMDKGFVELRKEKGGLVIGERLLAMARCRQPLDDFADPSVHAPFFTGRSFQTA